MGRIDREILCGKMIKLLIINLLTKGGEAVDQLIARLELLNRRLHQAHRNAVAEEMALRGLKEVNHPVLLTILKSAGEEQEGNCCAQRDLARLLEISPAAVANSLKSLEKGGYIHREPVPEDARRNRVVLTPEGLEAVTGCEEVFGAVSARMLAGFTPEEKEILAGFRTRMLKNLRGETPEEEEGN